jgi:ferredoxin
MGRSAVWSGTPEATWENVMKVSVDFDRCASSGTCTELVPSVFEIRDDGYLYILIEEPDEDLRASLEEAVESCPTEAISLLD